MNYTRTFFILFLSIISINIFSQKLTKYTGRFENGFQQAGTATYYYYKEPGKDKKIKKGYFKYSLKQTIDKSLFSQYITGSYENNLKNKEWVYKIIFRDYEIPKIKGKATGQIVLTASYVNGVPHGPWTYHYSIKTREVISIENGREKWSRYTVPVTKDLSLIWHNGFLADTLRLNINNSEIIEGYFDYYSFFHEDWHFTKNNTEETIKYFHGRKQSKTTTDLSTRKTMQINLRDEKTESRFQKIMSTKVSPTEKLEDLPFTLDTVSILDNPVNIITGFINKNIYQNKYLMFDYIPGDLYNFKKLDGGFELNVIIQATAEQESKIKTIETLSTNLTLAKNQANYIKSNSKEFSEEDYKLVKTIDIFSGIAKKYLCLSQNLVLYENVKIGMKEAETKCEGEIDILQENIPEFNSKNEALDFFISDLETKYESAQKSIEIIKK